MKRILAFQSTTGGNRFFIETDMQHGVFNKIESGRKRLSIVRSSDTPEELLARVRIVGGRNIELIKTTWAHFNPSSTFACAMYDKAVTDMTKTFDGLPEVARAQRGGVAPTQNKRSRWYRTSAHKALADKTPSSDYEQENACSGVVPYGQVIERPRQRSGAM